MRIVLAYSGGLDTSVALHWLKERYDAEVIAFCADIGQLESLPDVEARARATGADQVFVEPLTDRFLEQFALPSLQAHARYEEKYLLAAPLSRPLIAQRMVEIAHETGADAVAHGATGKGNDQIRFHASVTALDNKLTVLAPVIDWELRSREEEVAYARERGIDLPSAKTTSYSIDTNIWGSSIECGPLDDIGIAPPRDAWQLTTDPREAPDEPEQLSIGFVGGVPVSLNGRPLGLADLVRELNTAAARHGVGRVDIIEGRLAGFKTRGIYEAPAATVLLAAHGELEALVLDRETLHEKQRLAHRYADLVYYGYWFSDLRRGYDAMVARLQESVQGEIGLALYKGNVTVISRESPFARYDRQLATYDEIDTFDHQAGAGFSYVWALPILGR